MIIYKITNTVNNKIYIGQTTGDIKVRMRAHSTSYKRKNSKDTPIAKAIKKHGWNNFIYEVIEECDSIDELNDREIYWINHYDSLIDNGKGYNAKLGGSNHGRHSEYTKRKIGVAQKGEKNHAYGKRGKLSATSKRVIDMETGIIYDNATIYADKFGLIVSKVCAVCRGTRGSTGGKVVRYVDEDDKPIIPSKSAGRRINIKVRNVETGQVFDSIAKAARHYNLTPSNLANIIRDNDISKTFAGYHWEMVEKCIEIIK